jgi:hypothetical protein
MTKVSWEIPSGRQWGHPFYPFVEYQTQVREFNTYAEAKLFAEGLRHGNVLSIKIDGCAL